MVQEVRYRSRLLFMCSGYYRYSAGYTPDLPGLEEFAGTVVHPNYGRTIWITATRVAVIGSGARR